MKYTVIGLGNFGSVLAVKLTEMGHEVIGVDRSRARTEDLAPNLSGAIALDAADPDALATLPLEQMDKIVVAVAESIGESVQIVAQLHQMGYTNVVARAFSDIHRTILEAIGVERITMPEREAAELMARSLGEPAPKSEDKK